VVMLAVAGYVRAIDDALDEATNPPAQVVERN